MGKEIVEVRKKRAYELHTLIAQAGKKAIESYLEIGIALKEIRDQKYYQELGHDTFEIYIQTEWNLPERTAYNYITVIEKIPANLLPRVATSGIEIPSLRRLLALPSDPEFMQNLSEADLAELAHISDPEFSEAIKAIKKDSDGWHARYQKAYRDKEKFEQTVLSLNAEKTQLSKQIEEMNDEIFILKSKEENEKVLKLFQERDNLRNQLVEVQSKLHEKESQELTEEQAFAIIRKSMNQVLEALINLRRVQLFESVIPQLYGTYSMIKDMLDSQIAYLIDKFEPSTGPLILKHIAKDLEAIAKDQIIQ